jgi:hypothetical protein
LQAACELFVPLAGVVTSGDDVRAALQQFPGPDLVPDVGQ